MILDNYFQELNSNSKEKRLNALREIKKLIDSGKIKRNPCHGSANNHIHTTYSFSPYSPTCAVFEAWRAGLDTCGIIDHDGIGGCREFYEAGKIINMPVTCGLECRVKTDNTRLFGRMINNTDQKSIAYVVMHAIPLNALDKVDEVFKPLREKRNERNVRMCEKFNEFLSQFDISISYQEDVLPLSNFDCGGVVTERHICLALVKKLISILKDSKEIISFLVDKLVIPVTKVEERRILEENPNYYEYDILCVLKKNIVDRFYIDADEECIHIKDFVRLTKKIGCISAYAYLGDVIDTSDGDKKNQRFEDSYLGILMQELKSLEFDAITYMPSRNTRYQLEKVMGYCKKYSFFEINGEDINSPRQSFLNCLDNDSMFDHLKEQTYALIGHEIAVTNSLEMAIFSPTFKKKYPSITDRINYYKEIAKKELKIWE